MGIDYIQLVTASLAFTIALAWNDAVNTTVRSIIPPYNEKMAAYVTIIYAVIITLFVVVIVTIINSSEDLIDPINVSGELPPIIQI